MYLLNRETNIRKHWEYSNAVCLEEGRYVVRNLTTEQEKIDAYHLRHRIFCRELGWLPKTENKMERDDFDDNSISFGVYDIQNVLQAYLRLIIPGNPFMIESVFSSLVSAGHAIRKERDTAEISRLCVAEEARGERVSGNFGFHGISMFLYKGLYHWCLKKGIRFLYLVVEEKIYRMLSARGFPSTLAGHPRTMPDGVRAVASLMDLRVSEETTKSRRPKLFEWFTQGQANPIPPRPRQPEPCLPRRAFA